MKTTKLRPRWFWKRKHTFTTHFECSWADVSYNVWNVAWAFALLALILPAGAFYTSYFGFGWASIIIFALLLIWVTVEAVHDYMLKQDPRLGADDR